MVKITNTTLFFVLCLVTCSTTGHTFDGMHIPLTEDLELERQINKPYVKSILTKSGYIVDCVDINKQPAFDHPLLKNHTLQRKPSFEEKINETSVKSSSNKPIYWLENIRCPKGTVPIQRITSVDLIRGKSVFNDHNLIRSVVHEAYVFNAPVEDIHGIKGITSIYNPKVDQSQSSSGHLFIQNDVPYATNKIVVGWHVFPKLYNGDHSTYLYSVWTSDNFKNIGCYNMLCKGFVQTDRSYYLGSRIRRTSTYGGEMIEMPISLNKDQTSHNWWLTVAGKTIGYFPAALFPNMVKPSGVGWGGSTLSPAGTSSPPMGSGHFPDKNFVHASYFREVGMQVDDSGTYYDPSGEEYSDADFNCYNVKYYGNQGEEFGYSLQFGGPGCRN
ncbi:hypothetical protein P8452_44911 [Trifolium repens]|nr:hypothetical protein QL285_029991 [Trifolium repens]WJX59605.1 hypothetical protein P8452_44911 [Trifolium repens]